MGVLDFEIVSDEEFQATLKRLRKARKEVSLSNWYTDLD
jgi:hypothetical protein